MYRYETFDTAEGYSVRIYNGSEMLLERGGWVDSGGEEWAKEMVKGLTNGSVVYPEPELQSKPGEMISLRASARAKLAALGLTEGEIAALVG